MTLTLHAHPFSSYCQKVLIALYEAGTPFATAFVDQEGHAALKAFWPIGKFPVLVDSARGETVPEASIIIEYLDSTYPGPSRLLPEDAKARLEVRLLDRFFDNYVMTPQGKTVADALRTADERDPKGVADAHAMLDTAYRWLDARMSGREWAVGDRFSLADCAAAPSLFYADWVHPIGDDHANVAAYLKRLRARPSFARAVDQARPHRHLFPLGVPDHAD